MKKTYTKDGYKRMVQGAKNGGKAVQAKIRESGQWNDRLQKMLEGQKKRRENGSAGTEPLA